MSKQDSNLRTAAVKERSLIQNSEQVQAILAGRRTQFRVVVKPQPKSLDHGCWDFCGKVFISDAEMRDHLFHEVYGTNGTPYGALWGDDRGDRIRVKEPTRILSFGANVVELAYLADNSKPRGISDSGFPNRTGKVSARNMPIYASRITLEITEVRVERLQEIGEADAIAEGCEMAADGFPVEQKHPKCGMIGWDDAREWFADTWDAIHGDGAFDRNPWVWAISFRKL